MLLMLSAKKPLYYAPAAAVLAGHIPVYNRGGAGYDIVVLTANIVYFNESSETWARPFSTVLE